jgi:hypothetical protein
MLRADVEKTLGERILDTLRQLIERQ